MPSAWIPVSPLSLVPANLLRWLGRAQWGGPVRRLLVRAASRWLRHRDLTIAHGAARGMRFNAGGANPGYALGTSEPRVQEFFATALRPGMVFWDVGANVGFFTVLAARLVGPDGHVVAIEPMPENLRALRHNVALNNLTNVIVVPCAAAARREQLRMLRGHEPTWSRVACNGEGDAGEPVQGEPLDALPARFGVAPPDVVKLDVEGAECDALAGMAELLGEKRPVIVAEMHGRSAEFARVLRDHGYVLRTLESALPVEEAPWWVHVVATPTGALGAPAGAR